MPRLNTVPFPLRGIFYALIAAMLLMPVTSAAQRRGRLAGRVYDVLNGKPVPKALVAIQGTTISTLTDDKGAFQIDLPAGKYGITIFKAAYYSTNYQDIEIERGRITTYKCEMVPGDPSQNLFFNIGGITVLEKRDLIPQQIESVHEITSDQIEHHLATNLGDVLDIVPGIERTTVPGLSELSQVDLRGASNVDATTSARAALFGTKVMIDDIVLSNNANLQSGPGTANAAVSTTAGSGVDLRRIPADNIEKVEVVTGVPSAEYGDLTTGLVKVKTKMGRQPHRLKLKSNPDTKESNLSGGMIVKGTGFSYNVNYAYSERDIRTEGDEYSRYSGQVTVRNKFLEDKLELLNKVYYTGVLDEWDVDLDDPLSRESYNKDWTLIYGQTIDAEPLKDTKLEWRANISYTKRDSYSQALTGADTRVLTDNMETGTVEGVLKAGSYLYQIYTKGEEWNVNAKLNFKRDLELFGLENSLLAGGEYTFDDNVGQGKIYDPFNPPYGNLGYRPLSFDEVPALHMTSFYLEDEIKGYWRFHPYSINLGLRYEMYNPYKLHLDGIFNEKGVVESKNGTYLNPRIRLKYEPLNDTQIRFSWGKSSKMPSMTNIYNGPVYFDVVEENVSPPDSVPLISTYVYNWDNTYLKGYQNEKTELSLDRKIGPVGLTVTGFYSYSSDIPRGELFPITLYRYRWETWPDGEPTPIDTIFTSAGSGEASYQNVGWHKSYGVEFMLTTKRIERFSTAFRVSASYYESGSGGEGTYPLSPRISTALDRTIYPYYHFIEDFRRKLVVNYSADWFMQKLGLWITFFLQQTLFDGDQDVIDPDPHATAYYDPIEGRLITITPERSTELGLDRVYDDDDLELFEKPNDRFLFNVNISKSIGRGAELSLFVHNVLDDPAYYINKGGSWLPRNHEIFYGVEYSMVLDGFWRQRPKEAQEH
jgi:outer membrane receptor protein involved in Fe transport